MSIECLKNDLPKILNIQGVDGWKIVEIRECGEKLVPLNKLAPEHISVESQYYLQKLNGALKECYCRETVAQMLCKAAKKLPHGYKLVIFDAWRPINLQRELFDDYKKNLKSQGILTEEVAMAMAQKYVSLPSVAENRPSPHSTGGAIDLSIIDSSGHYLDMGTTFDDFSDKSHTRYYEQKEEVGENLSPEEVLYRNNRRLLYQILTSVGFTNYPEEWWHFDYGDQFWGRIKGMPAIYGKIPLSLKAEKYLHPDAKVVDAEPGRMGIDSDLLEEIQPLTADNPIFQMIGIGASGKGDISSNKHKYLSEAKKKQ